MQYEAYEYGPWLPSTGGQYANAYPMITISAGTSPRASEVDERLHLPGRKQPEGCTMNHWSGQKSRHSAVIFLHNVQRLLGRWMFGRVPISRHEHAMKHRQRERILRSFWFEAQTALSTRATL